MLSPLPPPPPPPPPPSSNSEGDGDSSSSSSQPHSSLKRRVPLQARLSERGQEDPHQDAGAGTRGEQASHTNGMAGRAAPFDAYSLEASDDNRPAGLCLL